MTRSDADNLLTELTGIGAFLHSVSPSVYDAAAAAAAATGTYIPPASSLVETLALAAQKLNRSVAGAAFDGVAGGEGRTLAARVRESVAVLMRYLPAPVLASASAVGAEASARVAGSGTEGRSAEGQRSAALSGAVDAVAGVGGAIRDTARGAADTAGGVAAAVKRNPVTSLVVGAVAVVAVVGFVLWLNRSRAPSP